MVGRLGEGGLGASLAAHQLLELMQARLDEEDSLLDGEPERLSRSVEHEPRLEVSGDSGQAGVEIFGDAGRQAPSRRGIPDRAGRP